MNSRKLTEGFEFAKIEPMKKCLVGIVSWCDSQKFPERFRIFKKCVASLEKFLPRDLCTVAVVDNNSSTNVQSFIESSSAFDIKVMLPENIHDVGAYGVLAKIADDEKLPYLWILENDYLLYRHTDLESYIKYLELHQECGYLRLQKINYQNIDRFDKSKKKLPGTDNNNTVWLKNIVTGKELTWSKPYHIRDNTFYINNWHFGLHGGLISVANWTKIYPQLSQKVPFYYKFEKVVRENYQKLHYKTAVLDGGIFSMCSPTIYQKAKPPSLLEKLKYTFDPTYGGYTDGKTIRFYQKNYKNFTPVQIQLFSNSLGKPELKALQKVFASRWLGYGTQSKEFESKFAQLVGAKYALGISSCTAGIFMSMEMLGIGKGDEVIMPTIGFVACANAVIKAGAKPIFADVDTKYFNLLPTEVERLLTSRTKAIFLLHYGGIPAEIDKIKALLKRAPQKVYLIEDSANSIKSLYKNKYCGTLGDIGLFSLDTNKVITTGTGGIMTINDDKLFYKAKVTRFYGLTPTLSSGYDAMRAKRERWWEIELEYPGNRYLINDIVSAIALEQLNRLDKHIAIREKIWHLYNQKLKGLKGITLPFDPPANTTSSYYFYWIQVKNAEEQLSMAKHLVNNGVYTTFRYYPLHLVSFYHSQVSLPNSEKIGSTTLNLPLHHNLTPQDIERVVALVKNWSRTVI